MTGASPKASPPPPASRAGDRASLASKVRRSLRKFGPLGLILTLLFAITYFLVGIYWTIRHIKHRFPAAAETDEPFPGVAQQGPFLGRQWAQHRMVGRGTYGFVQWSAYRTSPSDVVAIGFGSSLLRDVRKATACTWHGEDGISFPGVASLQYPEPSNSQKQYEVILIACSLNGRVMSHLGGKLVATLDRERITLYHEDADSAVHQDAVGPPKYKVAFCTYPLVGPADGERLREWLDIHRFIGAEKVYAYDAGGMTKAALAHVVEYLRSGVLEVTPMRDISRFDVGQHGRLLAMHDCMYRASLVATWAVFLEWDSILYLKSPLSLAKLLDARQDAAWMSFGCSMFSTKVCLSLKSVESTTEAHHGTRSGRVAFPQERMVYHWPHFMCHGTEPKVEKDKCPGKRGGRSLIVNTNKVTLLGAWSVVHPTDGGVDLSAEDVRSARFEDIQKAGMGDQWCKEPHKPSDSVDWWVMGTEVQELVRDVRRDLIARQEGS